MWPSPEASWTPTLPSSCGKSLNAARRKSSAGDGKALSEDDQRSLRVRLVLNLKQLAGPEWKGTDEAPGTDLLAAAPGSLQTLASALDEDGRRSVLAVAAYVFGPYADERRLAGLRRLASAFGFPEALVESYLGGLKQEGHPPDAYWKPSKA